MEKGYDNKQRAFTLAEVLITLAIIGVVSALVIPSVITSYNDKKYNTARLKALKTFGDAGKMASINNEINGQANAQDFVNNVLSKYLKIVRVCDTASECDFPSQIQPLNPAQNKITSDNYKKWNQIFGNYTNIAAPVDDPEMSIYITTTDGYSAKLFYNPKCARHSSEIYLKNFGNCNYDFACMYHLDIACMNVIYDMNGKKAPNQVGNDIGFVTTFWSGLKTTSVAPSILPYDKMKALFDEGTKTNAQAIQACDNLKDKNTIYTLPSVDEMSSILINKALTSPPGDNYWTGSPAAEEGSNRKWFIYSTYIRHKYSATTKAGHAWCVRR